jgi:hypothetical protein
MTSFERATTSYDREHESALIDAIMEAMVIRTGEIAKALTKVLAVVLAMSPAVTRSPAAIRRTADEVRRQLLKRSSAAASDPELHDFLRRVFKPDDDKRGGHA